MTTSYPSPATASDLMAVDDERHRHVLIRGVIIELPLLKASEASVVTPLIVSLGALEFANRNGTLLSRCGFVLERDPDTVVGPAIS